MKDKVLKKYPNAIIQTILLKHHLQVKYRVEAGTIQFELADSEKKAWELAAKSLR